MKVVGFYVAKNQYVVQEKDVQQALVKLGTMGVSALVVSQVSPILMSMVGSPIVAHASTTIATTGGGINDGVDKILSVADELIVALQKVAEPAAYGFCVKGILEKMSGQDNVGTKHMKEALKGYVTIQVLPMIFDMINVFR